MSFTMVYSQQLENLSFEQRNNKVFIYYDLLAEQDMKFTVEVACSNNGGKNYPIGMFALEGHVGTDISPGRKKTIVWDVLKDRNNLNGDRFVFKVTANYTLKKEQKIVEDETEDSPTNPDESSTKARAAGTTFINQKTGATMVWTGGGTFKMGCTGEQSDCGTDEKPEHNVTVDNFAISQTEVTHAQYIKFMNEIGVSSNGSYNGTKYVNMDYSSCAIGYRNGSFYFKGSSYADSENCPMIEVTWYGAKAYCEWAGGRLPTEAEWEYAARGGALSKGYKYAGSNNIDEVAEYDGNNNKETKPVAGKKPNELGIYDMSGNVWEWCSDWYGDYSSSSKTNPKGPSSGSRRVLRGGGWRYGAEYCRVAYRDCHNPVVSYDGYNGFRLCRTR